MNFDIKKHTILEVIHGSHAYGTNTPESDLDIRGIAVPPENFFFGFHSIFEQHIPGDEEDTQIWDIRKFFRLAADCNPNVIEILNVPDRCIRFTTKLGEKILANRDLFLSQKAKFRFSGFAMSQLKRMRTHRGWLLDPPTHKPARDEFQLPNSSALSPSIMGALNNVLEQGGDKAEEMIAGPVMELYKRERSYHEALRHWQQYQKWQTERNPNRAILEAKYGYDTKDAMHLVRVMRMAREIILTGKVIVERPDKDELLAIKNGLWKYEEVLGWAEKNDNELNEIYEDKSRNCILPHSPDIEKLENLCVEISKEFLKFS